MQNDNGYDECNTNTLLNVISFSFVLFLFKMTADSK